MPTHHATFDGEIESLLKRTHTRSRLCINQLVLPVSKQHPSPPPVTTKVLRCGRHTTRRRQHQQQHTRQCVCVYVSAMHTDCTAVYFACGWVAIKWMALSTDAIFSASSSGIVITNSSSSAMHTWSKQTTTITTTALHLRLPGQHCLIAACSLSLTSTASSESRPKSSEKAAEGVTFAGSTFSKFCHLPREPQHKVQQDEQPLASAKHSNMHAQDTLRRATDGLHRECVYLDDTHYTIGDLSLVQEGLHFCTEAPGYWGSAQRGCTCCWLSDTGKDSAEHGDLCRGGQWCLMSVRLRNSVYEAHRDCI